jgi:hypothetical protein
VAERAPEPWEPDPRWNRPRTEAFVAYRDMPSRTFAALARELRKSGSMLRKWAQQDDWEARVKAWDAECDRVLREEFAEGLADVARAQAADAAQLREALLEPARAFLAWLAERRKNGEDPWAGLTAAERVRLVQASGRAFAQVVTAERLAHGLSTDNLAGHDGGPLVPAAVQDKTADQLAAYLAGVEDGAVGARDQGKADR